MGIIDFGEDNEPEKEHSGNKKKYERITREDVEEFFDDLKYEFVVDDSDRSNELVYESTRKIGDDPDLSVKVFSSIDERTGKGRDKGSDAIRTVLWNQDLNAPISGRKRTHRIKTWRKNLRKKIKSLMEETDEYVNKCPECGGYLVEREGKYGAFLGCTNYPQCDHTEQIED